MLQLKKETAMKPKDLIKSLMDEKNISYADMARHLGISRAALWDRLNNSKSNNMTVSNFSDMLSFLGYRVVVAPVEKEIDSDCTEIENVQ